MSGGGKGSSTTVPRYYAAVQCVAMLGVADEIQRLTFGEDDRVAWEGAEPGDPNGYGTINVSAEGLYGGDKMEGGVSGKIEVGMGYPTQPRNSFLATVLDALIPAYRGLTTLIFKDFYWGNIPYPKGPKARVKSIHKMWDGAEQWYDEKSEVPDIAAGVPPEYLGIESHATGWKYLVEPEATVSDYSAADYNDSGWPTGSAPFYKGSPHTYAAINTWGYTSGTPIADDSRVWLRRSITLASTSDLLFEVAHDDGAFVYVDGVPVTLTPGVSGRSSGSITAVGPGERSIVLLVQDSLVASGSGNYIFADLELTVQPLGYNSGDINPSHFLREIHTNPIWGAAFPDGAMGATYTTSADTFYAEGFGISPIFTQRIEYGEMIAEVIRHVDAIPYEDLDNPGLLQLKPIRDDYDVETLDVIDASNSELEYVTDPDDFELFNQVIVKYWNRSTGKDDTVTVTNDAAIDMVGYINAKELEYPFFTSARTATQAANRDLTRHSRPFKRGRVSVNRKRYKLKPGDVFIGNWPEDGIDNMVCRVVERKDNGLLNPDIVLDFAEDIFGAAYTVYSTPTASGWVDPVGAALPFPAATAFELPYYLAVKQLGETAIAQVEADAAYFAFAGSEPATGGHSDYDLYAYPDGTSQDPDIEFSSTADFTPIAVVSSDIDDLTATVIPVSALDGMDSVRAGHLVIVGDAEDAAREVLALDATAADGDTSITVRRGLIDTVPARIPAGTVLYFIGGFYGNSRTEFTAGEIVEGYGTPRNGRGIYAGPYSYHDIDMQGRIYKPYPPGNLQINGQSYPGDWYVPPSNQVVFDWVHRDRVLQSDQNIDHFDNSDYGPEATTTYLVVADAYDSAGLLISANWFSLNVGLVKTYTLDLDVDTPPANTVTIVVRVWTVRDSELSLQPAACTFLYMHELIADEYTGLPIFDVDGNYLAAETL